MVYTRGSKEDFDRWANVTEDEGWSWNNLVQYMEKVIFGFPMLNIEVSSSIAERTLYPALR